MSYAALDEVAQGRVWTGTQARRQSLVDHSGWLRGGMKAERRRGGAGRAPAATLSSDYFSEAQKKAAARRSAVRINNELRIAAGGGLAGLLSSAGLDTGRLEPW